MQFIIKFVLFAAIVAIGCANLESPMNKDNVINNNNNIEKETRITCDILGSDAMCAAHCIGHGFAGGYCNSQKVCVCRR